MSMSIAEIREIRRVEPEYVGAPFIVPIRHWSPSSLTTLMRCPEQFRQSYVLKVKSKPRVAMVLGTANHSTHEYTFGRKIEGQETPLGEALDFYRDEAWPKAVKRDGGPDNIREWTDDTPDYGISRGVQMVTAYHTGVVPRVEPLAVEAEYTLPVEGVPVPLFGKVDIVTAGPAIDVKTSSRRVRTLNPGWRLQGRIYQLFTDQPVDWHVVTSTKTPEAVTPLQEPGLFQAISFEIKEQTEEQVRRLSTMANLFMHVYGPDNPWPTTGIVHEVCGWCGYRSFCVAWQGVEA